MINPLSIEELPIGVFDSGVGGLTVLSAIHQLLPQENLIYLGDTARVPYGTKSAESVQRYASQAAEVLTERKIKALVVACNTASAVALERLKAEHSDIPVIGVVEPGANAVSKVSQNGHIGVIATESTIHGRAYHKAIHRYRPEAKVVGKACSLFVALAEEGWTDGKLVEQIIERYLSELLADARQLKLELDALVLGCTHFPVLKEAIANVLGEGISLVDSASTTAATLQHYLVSHGLESTYREAGDIRFLVTDGRDRFARVAQTFFGDKVDPAEVELVDIPQAKNTHR